MAEPTVDTQRRTSLDLVLPPDPELLRVVRLVASGLASFTTLSLDGVEAVRVAADELVSTLIQGSAGGSVTVHLAVDGEKISIEASTDDPAAGFEVDPLTDRILDEVATSHRFEASGDALRGVVEVDLSAA